MIHGNLDYAVARLHARSGFRMRPEQWQRIGSARSLGGVLDGLRASAAGAWAEGIGVGSDVHQIEHRLRTRYRAHLDELVRWSDPCWQPALQWCRLLIDLPALRQAVRQRQAEALPAEFRCLVSRSEAGAHADVEQVWLRHLRQRLPALDADTCRALERLQQTLEAHRQRFSQLAPGNGWAEREALQRELSTQLRRSPLDPIQLLIWVVLLLLDYERVRGELLRLAALPAEGGA